MCTYIMQSVCDVLGEASTSDSDPGCAQSIRYVLKCLDSILGAPLLPPSLHKFENVVSYLRLCTISLCDVI